MTISIGKIEDLLIRMNSANDPQAHIIQQCLVDLLYNPIGIEELDLQVLQEKLEEYEISS